MPQPPPVSQIQARMRRAGRSGCALYPLYVRKYVRKVEKIGDLDRKYIYIVLFIKFKVKKPYYLPYFKHYFIILL